jgi:hypothetical protein
MGECSYSSTILDSARWKWAASRPGWFILRENVQGTHWTGGWVGPRADLDAVEKRKKFPLCRESNPRSHP